jgi:Carboxypeptidase regulatory-like domain
MRRLLAVLLFVAATAPARAQDGETGGLTGRVTDVSGGTVAGAVVSAAGPSGTRTARSDGQGRYAVEGLRPGTYSVVVEKEGFEEYGNGAVRVAPGVPTVLDVQLALAAIKENVNVQSAAPALSVEPDANAGAIIIKDKDLDALPDDPDELADALQALAGPAAGPNGGQIFIDGFTGGRMPPKASIREIRINANPFSAQYDRIGFGRIEIFTKPGTDQMRGELSYRFNDESLNTRNPFAPDKPPYQRRDFSANVGGPIVPKKASYFVDFDRRAVDDNEIVNATTLDPTTLDAVSFNEAVVTPQTRTTVSPRIDWQLGSVHSLTLRYTYTSTSHTDAGIGGFSLPSRAYDQSGRQQTFQLIETAVHGKLVSETHLQYWSERQSDDGNATQPTLQVQDAFTGGGAQVGNSSNRQKRFELQNLTSWARGQHSLRAGFRLRTESVDDVAERGFAGTVTFNGGFGPELDTNGQVVLGPDGLPVLAPLDSIERYRRTLIFGARGLSPAAIRALGGGPSQFQIVGGSPEASVRQWDVAPFVEDDWRATPDLLVSVGLRYELQDNITSHFDLAPRGGFAWSPGAKTAAGQPKTVIRGGFGVFYDRFGESQVLQARRYDGVTLQQYVVSDPAVLDRIGFDSQGAVASLPSAADLASFALPQTTWHVAPDLRAPYTIQSSLGIERQLPGNFTLSATFLAAQGRRQLRSRNLNAPLPDGTSPLGVAMGNVYQMESTGRLNQYQWIVGLNSRFNPKLTLFLRYFVAWAKSDTDGVGTFPANPYDLSGEYGRASSDVRHRIVLGGSVTGPWGIRVNPFLIASTGRPFNITIGRDLNGDSVFTDRPSLAASADEAGAVETAYGLLNPDPLAGEAIIPRNSGDGLGFLMVNLRISKNIRIGHAREEPQPPPGGPGGGPGFGGRPFGRGRGGRGGRGSEGGRGLTISLAAQNLINHVNLSAPVGNLSSPFFGESLATVGGFGGSSAAGNRRIELQARLAF